MSLFTSKREKRLWIWALVVLTTIYATLGFARSLVGLIPDRSIIDNLFMFGLLLVVAAAVLMGIKHKTSTIEIGVGIGVIAVYLLVFLRMTIPEERSHLVEYGIVALFIYEALKERNKNGQSVAQPALIAILITLFAGTIDEGIQWLLPNRVFDIVDIVFDLMASIMAISAAWAMAWARQQTIKIYQNKNKSN